MLASFRPKSTPRHRLSRFVTKEAIARLLKIKVEQIYRFECWAHILYVHAKGMSRFVSYADFPPVLGVESPSGLDFGYWKRRIASQKERHAPDFWVDFYAQKFHQAVSVPELFDWGRVVGVIKFMLPKIAVESLRNVYAQEKYVLEHF
ncbi:hypothetical protein [Microcoleus sp. Pol17_C1]|uniref:hypothetical protein n=1 Tax=unclassified Microcoleus TaxID=2642155 RepID=UPI002FD4EFAB